MFTKRSAPYSEELPASKRLRTNLADLFLTNTLPGNRAQSLFTDAHLAGADHFDDLHRTGSGKNAARNLRAKLMRKLSWPSLYYAPIRLWDPRAQREVIQHLPFLLPHEILHVLAEHNTKEALLQQTAMSAGTKERLLKAQAELGIADLCALGIWGDGVPANWDRTESYEVLALSLPGIHNFRVPLTVVSKKFWVTRKTSDDMFAVLSWSLSCSITGYFPLQRHDDSKWMRSDSWRRSRQGRQLEARGVVAEIRADWVWLASCFRMPPHNAKANNCYKCHCKGDECRDSSLNAPWRGSAWSHWDMMASWLQRGVGVCPLWSAPTVSIDCIIIDWLHCSDLGVGCFFLGNLLWACMPKVAAAGASRSTQCSAMYLVMKEFYSRQSPRVTEYDTLVPTMLKQPKQGPKLRGRGSEVRGLIGFGLEISERYLSSQDPVESTIKHAARMLSCIYNHLSRGSFDAPLLGVQARQFLGLYAALSGAHPDSLLWRIRAKMHIWLHLCESGDNPADTWCYRDEDFGGAIAGLARRRGGKNAPRASAERVLRSFCAKHGVPRF